MSADGMDAIREWARAISAETDEDRADLLKAVNDGIVPASVIERVLGKRGLVLKHQSIQRHRRKECGCE